MTIRGVTTVASKVQRRRSSARGAVKKVIATLVVTVSILSGGALVNPGVAEASSVRYMTISGVDVCRSQGHFGGSFFWYWNPNSWYCYDLSFPAGLSFSGPPQFWAYCRDRGYAGAEAWPRTTLGWRCFKFS